MSNGPKVLVFDIETAPILANVWKLWDNNVSLNQIKSDWFVLSWGAKWLDTKNPKVMYMDQRDEKVIENDKRLLMGIWKLLDEADVVVTQNGKAFDVKKLNARFIYHGIKPPKSYRHIDTLELAKKHFGFTSNKLEYMADKLCVKYKKLKHKKFPRFELWKECLAGNREAWKEMERYNKHDVLSLEELYTKLIPWDDAVDFSAYYDDLEPHCSCGSTKFSKNGFRYTTVGKYQNFKCVECARQMRSSINVLSDGKRKSLRYRRVA